MPRWRDTWCAEAGFDSFSTTIRPRATTNDTRFVLRPTDQTNEISHAYKPKLRFLFDLTIASFNNKLINISNYTPSKSYFEFLIDLP